MPSLPKFQFWFQILCKINVNEKCSTLKKGGNVYNSFIYRNGITKLKILFCWRTDLAKSYNEVDWKGTLVYTEQIYAKLPINANQAPARCVIKSARDKVSGKIYFVFFSSKQFKYERKIFSQRPWYRFWSLGSSQKRNVKKIDLLNKAQRFEVELFGPKRVGKHWLEL